MGWGLTMRKTVFAEQSSAGLNMRRAKDSSNSGGRNPSLHGGSFVLTARELADQLRRSPRSLLLVLRWNAGISLDNNDHAGGLFRELHQIRVAGIHPRQHRGGVGVHVVAWHRLRRGSIHPLEGLSAG